MATSHELTSQSDLSGTSRWSTYSTNFGAEKLHNSKKHKTKAKGVAGAFITCFSPFRRRRAKEAVQEDIRSQKSENSFTSTSKKSIASSSSSYKVGSAYTEQKSTQEKPTFTISEIYKATANFAPENIIGKGRFGDVYKGKLDGFQFAVKRAKRIMYDKNLSEEFTSEVKILSKMEHMNLVRFFGHLEQDGERLIVVEYISNGNLREHLDGARGNRLDFEQRLNIAIDTAHAIAYLHNYTEHPIIHRDIKSSNILLTDKFRAKVTDFSFAHLAPIDADQTHISTDIRGSAGYLDPEYLTTYQLTNKSDVYSYGVLLVELITGRRPIELRAQKQRATTRWAMERWREGYVVTAMDAVIRRTAATVKAAEKVMELAAECTAARRGERPEMTRCVEVLWGVRKDYREML